MYPKLIVSANDTSEISKSIIDNSEFIIHLKIKQNLENLLFRLQNGQVHVVVMCHTEHKMLMYIAL